MLKYINVFILISSISISIFLLFNCFEERVCSTDSFSNFKDGDIIFQTSTSSQSEAIQEATNSKFSHCGVLFNENGSWVVFEAVQPVKKTNLIDWVSRGNERYFEVKRLKNASDVLTRDVMDNMHGFIVQNEGKDYDLKFNWSDDRMYCSELVWKLYQVTTGIKLGKLKKLSEFNISNQIVSKKLKERYHRNIPVNEKIISPQAIYECPLLFLVEDSHSYH